MPIIYYSSQKFTLTDLSQKVYFKNKFFFDLFKEYKILFQMLAI